MKTTQLLAALPLIACSALSFAQEIALKCQHVTRSDHQMFLSIDMGKRIMRMEKPETDKVSITDSAVVGDFGNGFITVTVNRHTLRATAIMKTDQTNAILEYQCTRVDSKAF